MHYPKTVVTVFGIVAFLTLCSGVVRHDVKESKYLTLARQKQFECVGQIRKDTSVSGSCVLIGDRYVLSAAHVFIDSDTRADTIKMSGQTIISYTPVNTRVTDVSTIIVVIGGQKIKAKRLVLHPNYLDSATNGSCDLALIELERPVTRVSSAALNARYDEFHSVVVGVGYGASGPAHKPDLVGLFGKKIAGENVIDSLGGLKYLDRETLLMCDFDHPTNAECNRIGSATPRPLEYVCAGGDSGGGLFRQRDGTWELIGICSGSNLDVDRLMKTGYYGQQMQWTRVSAFRDWVNAQMH
ncbi:MAG: trypsin-like serine protease [Bacteroidetes bacterium]|nr:trypsin-like serine protease [Bacteroidota bacterium]